MKRITHVARLHLNKPEIMFAVPVYIIVIVMIISGIIVFAIQRGGGDPMSADYIDGARYNSAMMWALPGFLVYLGVQAVSTTFPFAMTLGASRRAFVAGTALANLIQSAYIALVMLALLGIELATSHWFVGMYVLDVYVLGAGNPWQLLVSAFLGTFLMLTLGGVFGAVWVRFGSKGPTLLGLALGLVLAVAVLVLVPYFGTIMEHMTGGLTALLVVVVAAIALVGTWVSMRRTAVR